MTRTTAIGYYHQNLVGLCQRLTDHLATPPADAPRERLWKVRAGQVVLAQGALEKPLVFDGNDRPGVMLAGAAQTYLNRYGVRVGDRPAVVTGHDSAWHAAFDLAEAGAKAAAIVDIRPTSTPLTDRARALGIETLVGRTVTGTSGRLRVKSLRVNRFRGGKAGPARSIDCDAVLMCGGWTPCCTSSPTPRAALAWDDDAQGLPARQPDRGRPDRRRRPRPLGLAAVRSTDGAAAAGAGRAGTPAARRTRRPTPSSATAPAPASPQGAADGPQPGDAPRPSSTSRTTSPPRTSASPSARACARSSTSSATPRTAWRPTRARCRTSTA